MKKSSICILIATHKKYQMINDSIYLPIQVGADGKSDLGYQKDSEGDNISSKNANYCELTGLYWAWKNLKCDVIGLSHYRRYLTLKSSKEIKRAKTNEEKFSLALSETEIKQVLENYDLIVPYTKLYIKDVYSKYAQQHYRKDLDTCLEVIKEKYPEYEDAFNEIMHSKKYCICNMFVMNKKYFDDYCHWLFDILFEVEKRTDISDYSTLQKRIYGFLSERLFNVWIKHNNLSVKEAKIVSLEKDSLKTLSKKAYRRIFRIKS